jgi:hypothetical protein
LFRIALLLSSIIILISAFVSSTKVSNIKDRYVEDVIVVISYVHAPSGYSTQFKYIYDGVEYDKTITLETEPTIADTYTIWVNPKDAEDIIFDNSLELQDKGAKRFKLSGVLLVLFILSFSIKIAEKQDKSAKGDVSIEDFLKDSEVTQQNESSKDT